MNLVPKISVVIPAYNAENYIGEAVESVLGQNISDFELLVIDDCSSDSTAKIVQNMGLRDSRIRLIRNPRNLGPGATRGVGVEAAQGEFIAWLDADDVALPNRLSSQISVLESDANIGVVGGYIQFFSDLSVGKIRRYSTEDEALRSQIFRQNPIASPAATFRASVYRKIGNYEDLRFCEDLEMLLRVGTSFKFANVPEVLVRYRQVDSSLTRKNMRNMEKLAISLRLRYRNHGAYRFGLLDGLFLAGQFLTLWMPSRIRIWAFSVIRRDESPLRNPRRKSIGV
jgi:glycosyltransferase involved in cell wall biosynthesis